MNVTLILGNGFDLNMGLPTAYSDFYKYYMLVDSPKSTNLIKQGIGEKSQTWADLEKSFGEISKQYGLDSDAYIEAFENVRDEAWSYRSVDQDMPIVFLATHHQLYEKIISNMQEVKSRNGRILAVVTEGDQQVKEIADNVLEVPRTLNALVPLLSVVRCSCLLIMWLWIRDWLWICREIWRRV